MVKAPLVHARGYESEVVEEKPTGALRIISGLGCWRMICVMGGWFGVGGGKEITAWEYFFPIKFSKLIQRAVAEKRVHARISCWVL